MLESFFEDMNSRKIFGLILMMTGVFLGVVGSQAWYEHSSQSVPSQLDQSGVNGYIIMAVSGTLLFICGLLVIVRLKTDFDSEYLDEGHWKAD